MPTITADNPHTYREEMERVTPFAPRLHVDLADGSLAPTRLVDITQAWLPAGKTIDLHLMYQQPADYLERALALQPSLIIVHAEATDVSQALQMIRAGSVRCGLALLPQTSVDSVKDLLPLLEYVLIFGGHLGYQGGAADLTLLNKVTELKSLTPQLEIGWDGGVDDTNAAQIAAAGVDVLNTGAFIQQAEKPADAYAKLLALAES